MENAYRDRRLVDRLRLQRLRGLLSGIVNGRPCIVIGSAPDPVVPATADASYWCVNGSPHSAEKYFHVAPDATFLNGALFLDKDIYAEATRAALTGKNLGVVLVSRNAFDPCRTVLTNIGVTAAEIAPVSKYDKRVILGEALGHSWWGSYPIDANVSNGLFMALTALWVGASEVILVGFSFNSRHAYSDGKQELSVRGHVHEDALCLEYFARKGLPVSTTSVEIHKAFGIRLAP